jgi:hypothetical protein
MLVMLLSSAAVWAAGSAATSPTPAPAPAAAASVPAHPGAMPQLRNRPKPIERVVDLNSASRKQLLTLPGIGPAEADKIIKSRPFLTKTELVTKGVLPTGPFLSIRDQVAAIPPGLKPPASKNSNSSGNPSSGGMVAEAPLPKAAASANAAKATP